MSTTDEIARMIQAAELIENGEPFDNLAVARLLRVVAAWQVSSKVEAALGGE